MTPGPLIRQMIKTLYCCAEFQVKKAFLFTLLLALTSFFLRNKAQLDVYEVLQVHILKRSFLCCLIVVHEQIANNLFDLAHFSTSEKNNVRLSWNGAQCWKEL